MELSSVELHVFVSLAVILGAAFIALLVDFLKGHNERLREYSIELKVRQEELEKRGPADPWAWFQKHSEPARSQHRAAVWRSNGTESSEAAGAQGARPVAAHRGRSRGSRETMPEPAAQIASLASLRQQVDSFSKREAVEPVARLCVSRGPANGRAPLVTEQVGVAAAPRRNGVGALLDQVIAVTPIRSLNARETEPAVVVPVVAVKQPEPEAPKAAPGPFAYRPLLSDAIPDPPVPVRGAGPPDCAEVARKDPAAPFEAGKTEPAAPAEVPCTEAVPSDGGLQLPWGFYESGTLACLLEEPEPFTGLVVAIKINDFSRIKDHAGRTGLEDLKQSVTNLVRSLLGPEDFGCRASDDEFVVVCPANQLERPPKVLTRISERLWDFQLRSLGSLSVTFRWGAEEARGRTLGDALARACEHMEQTRRNPRAVQPDSVRRRVAP